MAAEVKLRLIGDGKVHTACGDHAGRVVGVSGGDDLDLETRIGEIAQFLRQNDGAVIGVHEPVEHEGQLVLRLRLCGKGKGKCQGEGCQGAFHRGAFRGQSVGGTARRAMCPVQRDRRAAPA